MTTAAEKGRRRFFADLGVNTKILASVGMASVAAVAIGITGGLVVGLTSVGSGSLMIILLLMLYPRLNLKELVGTDLVQAVPLVASAAVGHLLYGDFQLGLTGAILIGSVPGVFLGARFSSRAPDYVIRPALIVVLFVSAAKLLGASNQILLVLVPAVVAAGVTYAVRAARRANAMAADTSRPEPATAPAHAHSA